jgi:HEAT repeat protein
MTVFVPKSRIIAALAAAARSPLAAVRDEAFERLGAFADQTELLIAGLDDPSPDVRETAAANLGRVRQPTALPALLAASRQETSDSVVRQVVGALASYRDPAALAVLLELLDRADSSHLTRLEIVTQLWKYDRDDVFARLAEIALGDDHWLVRTHAVDSLDLLDEVRGRDAEARSLWHRIVSDHVVLKVSGPNREPAGDLRHALARRLQHSHAAVRSHALHRLALLAPESAIELATPLLRDERDEVRAASCYCLGVLRDAATIPYLLRALHADPAPRVKAAALIGLEDYHDAALGEALLAILEQHGLEADALSILARQLWRYPSTRTASLVRELLASRAELPHRAVVESSLAFIVRLLGSNPVD